MSDDSDSTIVASSTVGSYYSTAFLFLPTYLLQYCSVAYYSSSALLYWCSYTPLLRITKKFLFDAPAQVQ